MKTALVIEDNSNNMELITFILKANGFKTLEADLGVKGVDLFTNNALDVVLLDIQLPDIDGTEVLRRIRETKKGASIPIIAVTSYAMSGDSSFLIEAGCDGYIEKPIDPFEFIGEVNRIVDCCASV